MSVVGQGSATATLEEAATMAAEEADGWWGGRGAKSILYLFLPNFRVQFFLCRGAILHSLEFIFF